MDFFTRSRSGKRQEVLGRHLRFLIRDFDDRVSLMSLVIFLHKGLGRCPESFVLISMGSASRMGGQEGVA